MNETVTEKKYSFLNKAAVLSLAVLIYTSSLTSPVLGLIAKSFPGVSLNTVKLISTIPSLVMVFVSLIIGPLERVIKRKQLLYIAMAFLLVGVIPAFFGNMTLILATRVFIGVAFGFLFPLAGSIIAQLFDGKERASMMGYRIAVGALFGVIFQTYAGLVGVINWRFAFLGFLIVIPVAILIIAKLPEMDKPIPSDGTKATQKAKLSGKTYFISIVNALYSVCTFSFMTNVAIVMTSEKIGNSAQAGYVLTIFSAASFVASMFYGKIFQIMKKYCMAFAILMLGCSYVILLKGESSAAFYAAGAISGIGFGLAQADFIAKVISSAPKSAATSAMGIMTAFSGIGSFASPYALSLVTGIFKITGTKGPWMVAAASLLAGCVIYTIFVTVKKPNANTES